ncbi:hypothetical protein ACQP04_09860 [Pseudonocardia halophobica]|uniref:hypothetical protein n=1 Tax=Pseudonocardia halophobica TaxID=29401 RepID=UPI003D8BD6B1
MAAARKPRRQRGEVERLRVGSYRVRVYVSTDPLSGKRHRADEYVAAGPQAAKEAEKVRTRLLNEVDSAAAGPAAHAAAAGSTTA